MKKTIFFVFSLFLWQGLEAPLLPQLGANTPAKLTFQFQKDDVYIIEKYQDVNIRFRNKKIHKQEKNRIILQAVKTNSQGAFFQGQFITYSRIIGRDSGFKLESQYKSNFFFQFNGKYTQTEKTWMPNIRSIPMFPQKPVSVDDQWTLPAEQVIKFNEKLYSIPLKVHYIYKGPSQVPKMAKHHPFYKKNRHLGHEIHFQYRFQIAPQNEAVERIKGYAANKLWFDHKKGTPIFAINSLVYAFQLPGQSAPAIYKFQVYTWYHKTQTTKKKEKDEIISQAKQRLKSSTKITVQNDPQGLKMTLDAINFNTDSARLTQSARQELKKIAQILKKYPRKEIRIFGHTDNRGSTAYNQRLSQKRALSVLRELKKLGLSSPRMSYKGFGENKPIANNKTAKGRAKNRRVEILMVTE